MNPGHIELSYHCITSVLHVQHCFEKACWGSQSIGVGGRTPFWKWQEGSSQILNIAQTGTEILFYGWRFTIFDSDKDDCIKYHLLVNLLRVVNNYITNWRLLAYDIQELPLFLNRDNSHDLQILETKPWAPKGKRLRLNSLRGGGGVKLVFLTNKR